MTIQKPISLVVFLHLFCVLPAPRSDLHAIMSEADVVNANGVIDRNGVGKHNGSEKYANFSMREEMDVNLHADELGSQPKYRKDLQSTLPNGWHAFEAEGGKIYYFDTVNGDTTWDLPTSDATRRAEPFWVLQMNTCWECQALPPFASGHFASVHCLPGEFAGTVDRSNRITRWGWRAKAGATTTGRNVLPPPASGGWPVGEGQWGTLVTSCSNNFLGKMEEWNANDAHDVIALQELGNPGVAGMAFIGRQEHTLPKSFRDQQMDPKVYQYLRHNVLQNYGVFGMVIAKDNIVTQATFWKKASLGAAPTIAVGIDTWHERPVSALFFAAKKKLIINYHAVHFRLQLIKSAGREKFGPSMTDLLNKMQKTDHAFSVEDFPTESLRTVFGAWVTWKIKQGLALCTQFGYNVHSDNDGQVFCDGTDIHFAKEVVAGREKLVDWKIYLTGDLNDELGELSEFKVFGKQLRSGPRLRTCCSDRDDDFKKFEWNDKYFGLDAMRNAMAKGPLSAKDRHHLSQVSYQGMTEANADYWFNDCGYFKTFEGMKDYLDGDMNPMSLPGAHKITKRLPDTFLPSGYPFPSDVLLSNVNGEAMDYPPGWVEDMHAMISDHDFARRLFVE